MTRRLGTCGRASRHLERRSTFPGRTAESAPSVRDSEREPMFLLWHELAAEETGVGAFRISESRMSDRQLLAEVAFIQG